MHLFLAQALFYHFCSGRWAELSRAPLSSCVQGPGPGTFCVASLGLFSAIIPEIPMPITAGRELGTYRATMLCEASKDLLPMNPTTHPQSRPRLQVTQQKCRFTCMYCTSDVPIPLHPSISFNTHLPILDTNYYRTQYPKPLLTDWVSYTQAAASQESHVPRRNEYTRPRHGLLFTSEIFK